MGPLSKVFVHDIGNYIACGACFFAPWLPTLRTRHECSGNADDSRLRAGTVRVTPIIDTLPGLDSDIDSALPLMAEASSGG